MNPTHSIPPPPPKFSNLCFASIVWLWYRFFSIFLLYLLSYYSSLYLLAEIWLSQNGRLDMSSDAIALRSGCRATEKQNLCIQQKQIPNYVKVNQGSEASSDNAAKQWKFTAFPRVNGRIWGPGIDQLPKIFFWSKKCFSPLFGSVSQRDDPAAPWMFPSSQNHQFAAPFHLKKRFTSFRLTKNNNKLIWFYEAKGELTNHTWALGKGGDPPTTTQWSP